MGNAVKVVLAAVFGYILGRRKKFKLAVALGMFFGAKKLRIDPRKILSGLKKEVTELPVVQELGLRTREQLFVAAKDAVNTIVTRWAGKLADSLTERTDDLTRAATETAEKATDAAGKATDVVRPDADEEEAPEEDEKPQETAGRARPEGDTGTRARRSTPRASTQDQERGDEDE